MRELKQLKTELSALDRKIQLELAPATPVSDGQEQKHDADIPKVETENTKTPDKDFLREHIHIVRPPNTGYKGIKIG